MHTPDAILTLAAFQWSYLLAAAVVLGALAVLFGLGLAVASRVFRVHEDPRIEQIEDVLPGVNCGACGYGGCSAYARAVAEGAEGPNECVPGGIDVARVVARIMGLEAEEKAKQVAVVFCQGDCEKAAGRFQYDGVTDCRAALLTQGASKACQYSCVGLGTCARICPFDAIVMGEDGLPHIIEDKCTACGSCVEVCPRGIISVLPAANMVHVLCRNQDKGAQTRKDCQVGCIACRKCEKVCPVEGSAVHVTDNLARVDTETCISCGKCVAACPMGTIGNFRLSRRNKAGKVPGQDSAA